MKNSSKNLIKNMGILTLSNLSSKILVFLLVPLYTSVLSEADVGIFELIVTTVFLLFPILSVNIVDAVMRFSLDRNRPIEEIIRIGFKFTSLGCLLFSLLVLIISKLCLFSAMEGMYPYVIIYFVLYAYNQLLIQLAKGMDRVIDMGIAGVLGALFLFCLTLLFLFVFDMGMIGYLLANIISVFVQVVFLFFRLRLIGIMAVKGQTDLQLMKEMLIYCAPLIITAVSWWINSSSDKYVVSIMSGVGASGVLSVAYKIPQIVTTLQDIFIQSWQITAVKEYDSKDKKTYYSNLFSFTNVMIVLLCLSMMLFVHPIASILFSKGFFNAWVYVPFLLCACVFNMASGFVGSILAAMKDSKTMAVAAVVGAVINLVLNIILVHIMGVQGVTIATAFASLIIFVIRMISARECMDDFKLIKTIVSWLIVCSVAVLTVYTQFSYFGLIGIMVIIFMYRIELRLMIKSISFSNLLRKGKKK